jgi:hypothetical protein
MQNNPNASQQHGIDFENEIHLALHGTSKKEYEKLIPGGYTARFDIVKGILDIDFNGSVKVSKTTGIGGSDILRMYEEIKEEPFTMIIGLYNQITKTKKAYHTIYEIYIKPEHHSLFWGGIKFDTLVNFVDYIKSIPHGKEAQLDNQKLWKEKRKYIYENENKGLMSINAKVDSGSQRRTQCGFDLKQLLETDIPFVEYTKNYKSIKLPYIQDNSPARKRHKK